MASENRFFTEGAYTFYYTDRRRRKLAPRVGGSTVLYRVMFHHFERFVAEYKGVVVA